MALFNGLRIFSNAPWDGAGLRWLDVPSGDKGPHPSRQSHLFDEGGYAVLRRGSATALIRYPRFRFRPSHADALHVDFWIAGRNIFRDAGTFSYAADTVWMTYFSGAAGHNTVQFDGRDQMPRLSRFLFGSWLRTSWLSTPAESSSAVVFEAGYKDAHGAKHRRLVTLEDRRLLVRDDISGFLRDAVLRWRLLPGDWRLTEQSAACEGYTLSVCADKAPLSMNLVRGWESRYYLQKTAVPVLEAIVHDPCTLITEFQW